MTCPQVLNSIGLVMGMVGVIIIFKFGPPQPNLETGVSIVLSPNNILSDGRKVSQYDLDAEEAKKMHSCMSKCGLSMIFIGFAFQLGATWWS